jgi:hypothetical protein
MAVFLLIIILRRSEYTNEQKHSHDSVTDKNVLTFWP